jgi:hypothetical protein
MNTSAQPEKEQEPRAHHRPGTEFVRIDEIGAQGKAFRRHAPQQHRGVGAAPSRQRQRDIRRSHRLPRRRSGVTAGGTGDNPTVNHQQHIEFSALQGRDPQKLRRRLPLRSLHLQRQPDWLERPVGNIVEGDERLAV